MDGNKRPKVFELKARQATEVKIESSASAKIGVVSIRSLVLLGYVMCDTSDADMQFCYCGFLGELYTRNCSLKVELFVNNLGLFCTCLTHI